MAERVMVRPNTYFDSVTLMSVTQRVAGLPDVTDVVVGMGTELNRAVAAGQGFVGTEGAGPNDLLVCIRATSDQALQTALTVVDDLLSKRLVAGRAAAGPPRTIEEAGQEHPDLNLAVISVPGPYAAREAQKALQRNMHVFLFSDNVTVADEVRLKAMARDKGLLVMGPDCGTAMVAGAPLGFVNAMRRGHVGIVGASGTGIQQVLALLDSYGEGVTHVIGTGGRDLSEQVGGVTTLQGIAALAADAETKAIVLISKMPSPAVADRVLAELAATGKPAVACFLGQTGRRQAEGVTVVGSLEETARRAVEVLADRAPEPDPPEEAIRSLAQAELARKGPAQAFVRGLYSGGSLCQETTAVLAARGIPVHSNVPLQPEWALPHPGQSRENTILDLGDDYFTRGKPHPMLEPSVAVPRLWQEAADPCVSLILFDVVLGYGSHPDPAEVWVPALEEARRKAGGRDLTFLVVVVGTEGDPQGLKGQCELLSEAGALVMRSNYRAALLAAAMAGASQRGVTPG